MNIEQRIAKDFIFYVVNFPYQNTFFIHNISFKFKKDCVYVFYVNLKIRCYNVFWLYFLKFESDVRKQQNECYFEIGIREHFRL